MVDVDKAITSVVRTGKVVVGAEKTGASVKLKRVKLVILASNCPRDTADEVTREAGIASIPVYVYQGTSLDLGEACGKPFPVSTMGVREMGDSDILNVLGLLNVE